MANAKTVGARGKESESFVGIRRKGEKKNVALDRLSSAELTELANEALRIRYRIRRSK